MNNIDYNSGHICPCCGSYRFEGKIGSHDICPICYWEDDLVQTKDPDFAGGANTLSLNQCRENYKVLSVCESNEEIEDVEK